MEKVRDIVWDITKYFCGCAKHEADFICHLEENFQSLEAKWNDLEAMKKDVEEKIITDEETGEMQRTYVVSSWLESIQSIQEVFNLYLERSNIGIILLEVISSLQQLRVLKVSNGIPLVGGEDSKVEGEFLKEVESLPKIEELNVEITTKNGLNKLFDSNKLQSCMCALRLGGLRDTITEMHLLLACISKMKHLRHFAMLSLTRVTEDSCIYDTTYSLTMLQGVSIAECKSLTHVTWLKYAPFLQLLVIGHCHAMEQVIKEDENVDSSSMFSSLVNLTLNDMPKLESIHKTALSFPFLKAIRINGCSNLKKLPLHSNSAKHKLTLINGEEDWWNNLE